LKIQIQHQIRYDYDRPVQLQPHCLLLHPRLDGQQQVQQYALTLVPEPQGQFSGWDLDGNKPLTCWFEGTTTHLTLQMQALVHTVCPNPFAYLVASWATRLPLDYPLSLYQQLQPALGTRDPGLATVAWEWMHDVNNDTVAFLGLANQRVWESCQYRVRPHGDPWPGHFTWQRREGSCRDFAVLLMDLYRSVGLAARFVSGYAWTDQGSHHLHAWVEVYIPGAGWRGYDPTQGLAVAEQHVAAAPSAIPAYTTPVVGGYVPGEAQARMSAQVLVQAL